jgi:two-component system sensor histidine kinase VicK
VSASYIDYAVHIPTSSGNGFVVYIKDSKEELTEMIWVLFAIIVQGLFVGLIIAVLLSFFLSKAITNPIENITKGAKLMAAGQFSNKLEVRSKDEIGTLTQTFNTMGEALKDTLEEVESERNKLETIFLYLADGVIAFSKEGKILHVNQAATQMLDVAEDPDEDFDSVFSQRGIEVGFEAVSTLEKTQNLVKDVQFRDRFLKIYFAAFETENRPDSNLTGGVIAVIHDATEQYKSELSRKEFVANVSHELRTPLTTIKSYTETILGTEDLPRELEIKFLGSSSTRSTG